MIPPSPSLEEPLLDAEDHLRPEQARSCSPSSGPTIRAVTADDGGPSREAEEEELEQQQEQDQQDQQDQEEEEEEEEEAGQEGERPDAFTAEPVAESLIAAQLAAYQLSAAALPTKSTSQNTTNSRRPTLREARARQAADVEKQVPWLVRSSEALSLPTAVRSVLVLSGGSMQCRAFNVLPVSLALWSCAVFFDSALPTAYPGMQTAGFALALALYGLLGAVLLPLLSVAMEQMAEFPLDSKRQTSFHCWPVLVRHLFVQLCACLLCYIVGLVQGFQVASFFRCLFPSLPEEIWRCSTGALEVLFIALPFQCVYATLSRFLRGYGAADVVLHWVRLAALCVLPLAIYLAARFGALGAAAGVAVFAAMRAAALTGHVILKRFLYGWQAGVKVKLTQRRRPPGETTIRRVGSKTASPGSLSFEDAVIICQRFSSERKSEREEETYALMLSSEQLDNTPEDIEHSRALKLALINRHAGGARAANYTSEPSSEAMRPAGRGGTLPPQTIIAVKPKGDSPIDSSMPAAGGSSSAAEQLFLEPVSTTQPAANAWPPTPATPSASLQPAILTSSASSRPPLPMDRARTQVFVRSVHVDNRTLLRAMCFPTCCSVSKYFLQELPQNLAEIGHTLAVALPRALTAALPAVTWAAVVLLLAEAPAAMAPASLYSQPLAALGLTLALQAPVLVCCDAAAAKVMAAARTYRELGLRQPAARLTRAATIAGMLAAGAFGSTLVLAALFAYSLGNAAVGATLAFAVPLAVMAVFYTLLSAAAEHAIGLPAVFAVHAAAGGALVAAAYALRHNSNHQVFLLLGALSSAVGNVALLGALYVRS